jgi:pimeloyl-ACP methyl ester carboxylesterase
MNSPWKQHCMRTFLKFATLAMFTMTATIHAQTPVWESLPLPPALPHLASEGYVERQGARIWYGTVGEGPAVLLLHGGMASSDSWGNLVPELVKTHHRVVLIDTRGHGRSTLGNVPLSYEVFEADVRDVMDALRITRADIVGWSDGANTALVMAMKEPTRLRRVYAFGANMNTDATKPDAFNAPILGKVVVELQQTYARLSPTPDGFGALHEAVETMQKSEPNYSISQLSAIRGPVIAIADGDHEEFIKEEHTRYMARTIPGARLIILTGVSHFAPWQAPASFNASVLHFLG